jgi:ABC-type uncharacterized transport system permease subunit
MALIKYLCDDEEMLNNFLILVIFISYAFLSLWQYLHVFKSKPCPTLLFQSASLIPVILNGWFLYTWIEIAGGQNLTLANMLALTAWCMNILILGWSLFRPILNLTLISYLFACLAFLIGLIFSDSSTHLVMTKIYPPVLYHVLFSIFGISLLGLAGIQSGLLLLQLSQLKNKPSSILKQLLPPLEVMEKFLVDILCLGCLTLSGGLFFGLRALSTENIFIYLFLPKTLLSLLGFGMISFVISRKLFFGLRTSLLAKSTLISILVLIFSYFGTSTI